MATTIIVADDHKLFREGICTLLNNQPDFEVLAQAENGREVERLARTLAPDVILMDISMPEQNGILATERILAANSQIRVIILSMHSHHRYIQNSFQAGASGFLLKDCAFDELSRAIHTVVKKQTYISPDISKSVISGFLSSEVNPPQAPEEGLTLREKEVLQALVEGNSTREAAALLCISIKTVETHRSNIMKKLQAKGLVDLIRYAVREGLTEL